MVAKPEIIVFPLLGTPLFRTDRVKRGNASIGIIAQINAKPNKTAQMLAAFNKAQAKMRTQETDLLLYTMGEDPKNAGRYYFMELYKDMNAVKVHGKMPHFVTMNKEFSPLMAGKPTILMRRTVGDSHASSN